MRRLDTRLRIDDRGDVEVIDPGLDSLELLLSIDPDFRIQTMPLEDFVVPKFRLSAATRTGMSSAELKSLDHASLWSIHETLTKAGPPFSIDPCPQGEASLLDVKCELASRHLRRCALCGHRCAVNRWQGELGVCGLGTEAYVVEHFVHIGEEPPINPSLVLNLAGCGLRCRYCQQGPLLNVASASRRSSLLEPGLWNRLDTRWARSLSFVGGNPDESLFAILRFLAEAPVNWNLPVVWNSHAFATEETMTLLNGIADVYVPDVKYGSDGCGELLSGVRDYVSMAQSTILAMIRQGVPVFVRMLILPGHVECCHIPCLRFLSEHRDAVLLSLRAQYCPDWKIRPDEGPLSRRPLASEVRQVTEKARDLGLHFVEDTKG
jgi:putative pyruvate formate lyase activating enzyme